MSFDFGKLFIISSSFVFVRGEKEREKEKKFFHQTVSSNHFQFNPFENDLMKLIYIFTGIDGIAFQINCRHAIS